MAEFSTYIDGWKRRFAVLEDEARARRLVARRAAETIRDLLRDAYGARRVILTGSLARGDFGNSSDIDLAVEGIADARFFEASAAAQRAAGDIAVDIVPLESASAGYRRGVAFEGVPLLGPPLGPDET